MSSCNLFIDILGCRDGDRKPHLTRKCVDILLLLKQVGGVAHVVSANHAIGVVHTDRVNSEPAASKRHVLFPTVLNSWPIMTS